MHYNECYGDADYAGGYTTRFLCINGRRVVYHLSADKYMKLNLSLNRVLAATKACWHCLAEKSKNNKRLKHVKRTYKIIIAVLVEVASSLIHLTLLIITELLNYFVQLLILTVINFKNILTTNNKISRLYLSGVRTVTTEHRMWKM